MLDRFDDAADLLLDLYQFRAPGIAIRATLAVETVRLFGIGLHGVRDHLRCHHLALQAGEDASLQIFL
ncbi:hypothetical protein ACETRX_36970 [Labrys portucalensis]|uniref:Uncharacterized protein n=1 Tax=Labrys neptuniae TaxID=376174 RepID=A0ABV6ZSI7_9HYPH